MADQIEQAGDDALRNQLMTLEAQREQLASLIGDDPKGPMQQLQVLCLLIAVFSLSRSCCGCFVLHLRTNSFTNPTPYLRSCTYSVYVLYTYNPEY